MTRTLWMALPIMLAAAAPAQAAVVLDQSTLVPLGTFQYGAPVSTGGSYRIEAAQSVTAGVTGILDRIDLMLGGDDFSSATLRLRRVTAGVVSAADADILGSVVVATPLWGPNPLRFSRPEPGFYSIVSIDVRSFNLAVTAGQMFAFSLETDGPVTVGWASANANSYANGTALARFAATSPWSGNVPGMAPNSDLLFATHVDTGAVPEPATWGLLTIGFGGIGVSLRARRRGRARSLAA